MINIVFVLCQQDYPMEFSVIPSALGHLVPLHMPEPGTALLLSSADGYLRRWHFPNSVVSILVPQILVVWFHSYKEEYYSVVLQGLADANYIFLAVEVRAYGKQSNVSRPILSNRTLYERLKTNSFNMLGDCELPQTNTKLPFVILAKRIAESSFGKLIAKWRNPHKQVETMPENVEKII
ncbi:hypothetical protein PR048_016873 [Dryococelus australis]|uniref:Maturase K n=1 Tax=Dryococelus australis TaxID=614101 RepID=A0ABQ9H7X9_9NEOP|nr:hypothetical protein PR048_016873 [Dryococelus australis]